MKQFLVLLFPGFEEIEAFVPIDLLRRVQVNVVTASVNGSRTVTGSHGIACQAEQFLESVDLDAYEGVFLPGGPGVMRLKESEKVQSLLRFFYEKKRWVAALCAAPLVLHKAGCLPKTFTAHRCVAGQLEGCTNLPVVCDGHVITGRGPGAVFPFAFELIRKLTSNEVVIELKESIHYEE